MLELLLFTHDGGTGWRHLLGEGASRAGWEPTGPMGLRRRFGTLLGVPVESAPAPLRLAAFDRALAAHDDGRRCYSRSRAVDPVGVARFLLALRDRLRSAGWDGRELRSSPRLRDLSAIERALEALPPGEPERLDGLLAALAKAGELPDPPILRLAMPLDAFDAGARRLVQAAAAAGCAIEGPPDERPLAPEAKDLGKLQRALLGEGARPALAGDGTLRILEADTPAEAAELLAASLRDRPLGRAAIVVPAEGALFDAALARQGLPTLGASTASPWRPALQLLPLRLELAFRPRDPLRAVELLLLPGAPLPAKARFRLIRALQETPGFGNPRWLRAIEESVAEAAAESPEKGERLRRQIDDWFGGEPHAPSEGIPAAEAARLCEKVAGWLRARGSDEEATDFLAAAGVAATLQALLAAREGRIPLLELRRLHDAVVGGGIDEPSTASQAGRAALCATPEQLVDGVSEVVHWAFVGEAAAGAAPDPWTPPEREELTAAGLLLDAPGARRTNESRGWRRAVLAAADRLTLVRWRLSGNEAATPHPFEDELSSRLAPGALGRCVVPSAATLQEGAAPAVERLDPLPPVSPRPVWRLPPATIAPRERTSYSELEKLFGCPLAWALQYRARLEPGRAAQIQDGPRLEGDFGHAILGDLLAGPERLELGGATPDEAAARVERAFDARIESEAAPLARPERFLDRERLRRELSDSARALVSLLQASGLGVEGVEAEVAGSFAGLPIEGRIDLLLSKGRAPRAALVDLKRDGRNHRDRLEEGRALQLAIYARLAAKGARWPATGYFSLRDARLFTRDELFVGAARVDGPADRETFEGAEKGYRVWRKLLDAGFVPATHEALGGWEEEAAGLAGGPLPEEGPARERPPCPWCEFATLCESRVPEEG